MLLKESFLLQNRNLRSLIHLNGVKIDSETYEIDFEKLPESIQSVISILLEPPKVKEGVIKRVIKSVKNYMHEPARIVLRPCRNCNEEKQP